MTDPTYGDNPLDPGLRWDQTFRPPLINDQEVLMWRGITTATILELAESSWLVRYRTKSSVTAKGVHLDAFGLDFGFIRPAGWSDDRYSSVISIIESASPGRRTIGVTLDLAASLEDGSQTWLYSPADPLTYVIFFFGLGPDEALTYLDVLERGRPPGERLILVYSEEAQADVFELDSSLLDGPDILMLTTETQ